MKDLIESVISSLNERVSKPFAGAYILSWLIVNYKTILILTLSDEKIMDRLITLENESHSYFLMFGLPAVLASFYIIISPFINLFFAEKVGKPHVKSKVLVVNQLTEIAQAKLGMVEAETQLEVKRLELEKNRKSIEFEGKLQGLELDDRETLKKLNQKILESERRDNESQLLADETKARKEKVKEEERELIEKKKSLRLEVDGEVKSLKGLTDQKEIIMGLLKESQKDIELNNKQNELLLQEKDFLLQEIIELKEDLAGASTPSYLSVGSKAPKLGIQLAANAALGISRERVKIEKGTFMQMEDRYQYLVKLKANKKISTRELNSLKEIERLTAKARKSSIVTRSISTAGLPNFSQKDEEYIDNYVQGIALIGKSASEMSSLQVGGRVGEEAVKSLHGGMAKCREAISSLETSTGIG